MKSTKPSHAPAGASLIVLSSLVYASYGVWTTLMGDYFGSFTQAVLRAVLVVLLLLPIALWRKQLARMHWRRDAKWLVALLISCLLIPAPLYYAVLNIGVGLGMGIAYAGIILGAFFFGWLFGGERYTKDKWVSTILGLIGLCLVFAPDVQGFGLLAMLAALLSGLGSGLNMVANKKLKYSPLQTAVLTWTATIVANIPLVFLLQERAPQLVGDIHWFYLALFALASLVASWSLISGLKLIEAGAAGILGLLEIVFAVLLGVVLFGEHPQLIVLVGMVCIVFAAAVPYIQHYNSRKGTLE